MKKEKSENKYWETEDGELIEFGGSFMRCYDAAGKLQFGFIFYDPKYGQKKHLVKFVLDRKELLDSKEGLSYLQETLNEWEEGYEN